MPTTATRIRTPRSLRERAVFVDSSGFYALLDKAEQNHSLALGAFEQLTTEGRPLFTSNLVVAETYALTIRRLGSKVAWSWVGEVPARVVFESAENHAEAVSILARYRDKDFPYADAVSFVLMERLGISTAFTFDTHFRQYGLTVLP